MGLYFRCFLSSREYLIESILLGADADALQPLGRMFAPQRVLALVIKLLQLPIPDGCTEVSYKSPHKIGTPSSNLNNSSVNWDICWRL